MAVRGNMASDRATCLPGARPVAHRSAARRPTAPGARWRALRRRPIRQRPCPWWRTRRRLAPPRRARETTATPPAGAAGACRHRRQRAALRRPPAPPPSAASASAARRLAPHAQLERVPSAVLRLEVLLAAEAAQPACAVEEGATTTVEWPLAVRQPASVTAATSSEQNGPIVATMPPKLASS